MAWETLLNIIQEARDIEQEELTSPPVSCPYDYTALKEGPDGILFCPWAGDYEYPRDGKIIR